MSLGWLHSDGKLARVETSKIVSFTCLVTDVVAEMAGTGLFLSKCFLLFSNLAQTYLLSGWNSRR